MNYLKTIILTVVFGGLTLSSFSQNQPYKKGENNGFLPLIKRGFSPQVSIAPQVAFVSFSDFNSSGIAYGVEVALQCPLFCTSKNYIRQQLSFLYYNDDNFTNLNITLNPEYRFYVTSNFELAAGPSLGVSISEFKYDSALIEDYKKTSFTYGASASATRHFNKIFIGISTRYFLTQKDGSKNYNNFQGIVKLGYKF